MSDGPDLRHESTEGRSEREAESGMSDPEGSGRDELGESEVRRIARLARLALTDRAVRELSSEISAVLEHFREIRGREMEGAAGSAGDEPSGGGVPGHTDDAEARAVLRSEGPRPDPLCRGPDALAPRWRQGFFVVPRLAGLGASAEPDGGAESPGPPPRREPEAGGDGSSGS